jgi:hypothetical protein
MATQQIVPQVVPFPQSVPAVESITQLELELLLSLRNRLKKLEDQVAAEEARLTARLEAGASVDPGVHVAEIKESWRRNVSWKSICIRLAKRLKLDGAAYCARVLASTKPTRSIALIVE